MGLEYCNACGWVHAAGTPCPSVPYGRNNEATASTATLPKKKEFVRVVTTLGHVFDMDKPDDFNMVMFATSIKANACILNPHLFQPLEHIATIFCWSEDKPPVLNTAVVLPFPGKPA